VCRECDLDILAATGQTRVLFWQIMPYTVVLSKLGEAFNFSPPYIEDAAMTERVSFKRSIDDTGKVGRPLPYTHLLIGLAISHDVSTCPLSLR
jgi:hypothetical protein